MNDAPELLPCPFCGEDAGPITDATRILGSWNIVHRCRVIGPFKIERSTRELTVTTWNTRTPEAIAKSDTVSKLIADAVAAERERAEERFADLLGAAHGLSYGDDWNNGTHAKTHGYRQKLLKAVGVLMGDMASPQAAALAAPPAKEGE